MHSPMARAAAVITETDVLRLSLNCCCKAAMGASNRLIREEIPANSTASEEHDNQDTASGHGFKKVGKVNENQSGSAFIQPGTRSCHGR